jgi:uncharacterized protein YqjF (DUF2071 family)
MMSFLKKIPIHYKGELHDVRLVNFSVEMREVIDKVPPFIKIRDFEGRALISMVDVKLKNMRPKQFPFLRFNYRHVAFRLLVDDSRYHGGLNKGIFFLQSFTNQSLIIKGSNLLTDYNLQSAKLEEHDDQVDIAQGEKYVRYRIGKEVISHDGSLMRTIGALDRAYSVVGNRLRVTVIQREKWPLQRVACGDFENTFFESAKLEGAFRVFDTIYYDWLPPKDVAR